MRTSAFGWSAVAGLVVIGLWAVSPTPAQNSAPSVDGYLVNKAKVNVSVVHLDPKNGTSSSIFTDVQEVRVVGEWTLIRHGRGKMQTVMLPASGVQQITVLDQ